MAQGFPQRPPLPQHGIGATGSNTFVYGKQKQHSAKSRLNRRKSAKGRSAKKRRVGKIPTTMRRNHTVKHSPKGMTMKPVGGVKKGDYGRQTAAYTSSSPFMPLARGKGMMRPRGRPRTKQGARRSGEIGTGGM